MGHLPHQEGGFSGPFLEGAVAEAGWESIQVPPIPPLEKFLLDKGRESGYNSPNNQTAINL